MPEATLYAAIETAIAITGSTRTAPGRLALNRLALMAAPREQTETRRRVSMMLAGGTGKKGSGTAAQRPIGSSMAGVPRDGRSSFAPTALPERSRAPSSGCSSTGAAAPNRATTRQGAPLRHQLQYWP